MSLMDRPMAISLEELITELNDAVDEGFRLGYSDEPYDVTDCYGYENYGKFKAYKYILDIITWGIK